MMNNLHPGLILIAVGIIAALLPKDYRKYALAVGPMLALAAMVMLPQGDLWVQPFINDMNLHILTVDGLSYIFGLFFCIMALTGGIYSMHNKSGAEALASMVYAGSTIAMVFAGDWMTLIFFWELMAISSLYLIWGAHTARSRKAGFRYLLLHMFGGNMLLAGIFLKVTAGDTVITSLTNTGDAAFWLIFIGVAVNAVVPPLSSWVADAYPESTITGGAFLSGFTTKAAIYVMIRLFAGTDWLIWVGVVMALFGAIYAIMENDMRRLLSFHIISQLGFMVAGVGMGTAMALDGATAHAVTNIFQKSMLFMCAGAVMYATGRRKLNQLGGLAKEMPLLCVLFLVAAFSISGVPGLDGFVAKSMTVYAAAKYGFPVIEWLLSIASIGTFLSITLKMTYFMFFAPKSDGLEVNPIPKNMYVALCLAAVMNTIFGIVPSLLNNLLPFGGAAAYHAYTIDHLTQYAQVLVASMLPFMLYLPKMKPHNRLSLDFDWFWRKPFKTTVSGISGFCCAVRDGLGRLWKEAVECMVPFANNPIGFFGHARGQAETDESAPEFYDPEKYRVPVSEPMIIGLLILTVVLAYFWIM